MDVYTANLAGLLALCGGLFWTQRQQQQQHRKIQALKAQQNGKGRDAVETSSASQASAKPQSSSSSSHWAFLAVYALVMASDWLQVCIPPLHLLTTTTVAETHKVSQGPVPLLPLQGRTRPPVEHHLGPLHHGLPLRRRKRVLCRVPRRSQGSQGRLSVLLRRVLSVVCPHYFPLVSPGVGSGTGPRRVGGQFVVFGV